LNPPMHIPNSPSYRSSSPVSRRQFLAQGGAAAAALATAGSPALLGADSPGAGIPFGLIGCGGRGKWIAKLFQKHGGYQCVAVHDYFSDKADDAGNELGVPADRRFSGLNGYRKLLEQKLDAVAIESPPYFHPEQAASAIAAGKHVYLAKPLAVDVPGCLSIAESGRKATASGRCFQVDFQTRAMPDYQEALKRVHAGALGKIALAEATYHCGNTFDAMNDVLRKDPASLELRMRAWGLDKVLSGDVITEQNIHALDVAAWALNADPVKAYGMCGQVRGFAGTCHDHFAVVFYYPGNIVCSFNSKQYGHGYDDIMCRVYGMEGTLDTHYGGKVTVRCRDDAFNGNSPNIYEAGAANNIATFHRNIVSGDCANPTVTPSVRSNLTTILGRTAAYRNQEVTWAEMMQAKEVLKFDLQGLKG
jgi:myo-inositol 2-dehydrogenase / D-chiro-inositol 1-dehydrogenase